MRYRRLSSRYALVVRSAAAWPFGDLWPEQRLRPLVQAFWRPNCDSYESETAIDVVVELAGVDEDDFEVLLFDNALVVEGHRRIPPGSEATVYHMVGIPQGPFRLELILPEIVDPERVEARYERGMLRIRLAKRSEVD